MKKHIKEILILIVILFVIAGINKVASGQSVYRIEDTNTIDVKLRGTSTMHDWEMDSRVVEGEAQFIFNSDNEPVLTALQSLSFGLDVKDLKSDNKGLDKSAYRALKTYAYGDIHYQLTSAIVLAEANGNYIISTHGKLTIAGVTKEIVMNVQCVIYKDSIIICSGTYQLNMTDYNIDPPSSLMGAFKADNTIALEFEVAYKKQKGV